MKYLIVEAGSASDLQQKVQRYIDEGWELQGGVAVATHSPTSWWYYQAVVLREQPQII